MSIAGAGGTYICSQTLSAGQPSFLSQGILIFNPNGANSTTITTTTASSIINTVSGSSNGPNPNAGNNSNATTSTNITTTTTTINTSGKIAEVILNTRYGTSCKVFIPPTTNLQLDLEVSSVSSYDGCFITFFQ